MFRLNLQKTILSLDDRFFVQVFSRQKLRRLPVILSSDQAKSLINKVMQSSNLLVTSKLWKFRLIIAEKTPAKAHLAAHRATSLTSDEALRTPHS